MRIPETPPNHRPIMMELMRHAKDLGKLLFEYPPTDEKGRYLHWEDLKRRKPPEGLTPEEHWAATKLARMAKSQPTPFLDKNGVNFRFCETDAVRRLAHFIDSEARGSIALPSKQLERDTGERYLVRSLVEEPFNSSVLEGAATTREIAKKLIREKETPRTKDERMVLNNYFAMQLIKENCDVPLTPDFVLQLHRTITENTLTNPSKAGAFRSDEDDIAVTDEEQILHTPPPAHELPERLERLCDFANEQIDAKHFVHPILRAIILHFMLGYDHPFVDGNGRTARALFYWSVLRSNYWLLEYVSISRVIKKAPTKYGMAYLHTETDGADLTYFIIHQLGIVKNAIEDVQLYLAKKAEELNQLQNLISRKGEGQIFNHRQIQILNEAIRNPKSTFTIAEHEKFHRVSYLTARKDLERLFDERLLKKKKKAQTSIYSPSEKFQEILQTAQ